MEEEQQQVPPEVPAAPITPASPADEVSMPQKPKMKKGLIISLIIAIIVVVGLATVLLVVGALQNEDSEVMEEDTVEENLAVDDDVILPPGAGLPTAPDVAGFSSVNLSLTNLATLTSGSYEGWAIFGEEKVSLGTFVAGESVELSSTRDLSSADSIVITIEPSADTDPAPSGVVVLAGDVVAGTADLAFPVDLTAATGNYVIATPTDGHNTNEASGVWFLTLPAPPTVGLSLPALPAGWAYEGWAVNGGKPLTSGRFAIATGADLFSGYSGTQAGPPFPGEDYLLNPPAGGVTFPINLADGASKAVITIEPDIAGVDPTGDGPYPIDFLVSDIPAGAASDSNLPMSLDVTHVPAGSASVVSE